MNELNQVGVATIAKLQTSLFWAKHWQKTVLAWVYGNMAASFSIVSWLLEVQPHKPVFYAAILMDGTVRYRSEINKSHPRIRAVRN